MKKTGKTKCGNLSENALFEAVAFPDEASSEIHRHIDSCPFCKREAEELNTSLAVLGEMACRSVPAMKRRILLPPEPEKKGAGIRGGIFSAALGAAFAVVLAVLATWTFMFDTGSPIPQTRNEYAESAPLIFEEPGEYAENVLPSDYIAMSGEMREEDPDENFFEQADDGDGDFFNYASPA